MEIWKDIPGYEGKYQVSSYGRVKSLNYMRTGKANILKPGHGKSGYFSVTLSNNGSYKQKLVHRLVWEAFNGPIPEGYEVNHRDENPGNNRLDNLNLLTHTDNQNWGTRNIRCKNAMIAKGYAKPVEQYSASGVFIRRYTSTYEASQMTGICQQNISAAVSKRRNIKPGGYIWRYA